MIILGIDPGFDRMGCAVLEKDNSKESLLYSTCILSDKNNRHEGRLCTIGKELRKIIKKYKPDIVAVESLFFSKNQKTAVGVAMSSGVVFYLSGEAKIPVSEYTPQGVKMALTGYGRADKHQVESMVRAILQGDFPKKALDDEVDAIAIALTCSAHQELANSVS